MLYMDLSDFAAKGFPGSYSFEQYRFHLKDLLKKGMVTGNEQTERLLGFTELNEHRMDKWDKHYSPSREILEVLRVPTPVTHWLVITEGWCGDSAQVLPMLSKMAGESQIELRIVLRDENDWLMQRYLTNGTRSIPILIGLDSTGQEIYRWGPRPRAIQELAQTMKRSEDPVYSPEEIKHAVHLYFGRDRGKELERDMTELISAGRLASAETLGDGGSGNP